MKYFKIVFIGVSIFLMTNATNLVAQEKFGPTPTKQQLAWHEKEFYLFMHFGPNTFTNLEWGKGSEDPNVFNPTAIDCNQWASIAKASGAKGIIITAKHHDGFSLWPSKFSKHTVRESKWMDGKGDVIKMLSEACKKAGIEMGVYISPWDRNHPQYGTEAYNDIYIQTMKELLTGYGNLTELWWDGANGEGPNGKKQVYDFTRFKDSAMSYQPNILIFSDIGPHIRWVGNENGLINETNWNLLDTAGFKRGESAPANDTLNRGNFNGKNWIGAEADVSMRKGWFYHEEEDSTVKSGKTLFNLYLNSVGHGGNLLLNVPPNRKGLIAPQDSAALMDFKKVREAAFKTNLFKSAITKNNKNEIDICLTAAVTINSIQLQEQIKFGQRVIRFEIYAGDKEADMKKIAASTTIGRKKIIQFPTTTAKCFKVKIIETKASPVMGAVAGYFIKN
ncbi:MAG: glycoside hydrolase family 29 (alpha-L-fucosidase) [Chitinophagaceae bacterium]|nr:glycoside hydrolase family 29 (alpha-L-fucosidase) [Chitinophagaceae bacterium]